VAAAFGQLGKKNDIPNFPWWKIRDTYIPTIPISSYFLEKLGYPYPTPIFKHEQDYPNNPQK
jgi:hypothetical protein